MTEHDRRWSDAASVLAGRPTDGADQRRRRSRRRRVGLIVSLPIVSIALGVIAFILERHGLRSPIPSHLLSPVRSPVVGGVVTGVGVAVELTGLVWQLRAKAFRPAWRSPLINLSRADRNSLRQLVRSGATPEHQRDLVAYMAQAMMRQRPYLVIVCGLAVLYLGQALQGETFFVVLSPVVVVYTVAIVVRGLRDGRRAERWLSRSPNDPRRASESG